MGLWLLNFVHTNTLELTFNPAGPQWSSPSVLSSASPNYLQHGTFTL